MQDDSRRQLPDSGDHRHGDAPPHHHDEDQPADRGHRYDLGSGHGHEASSGGEQHQHTHARSGHHDHGDGHDHHGHGHTGGLRGWLSNRFHAHSHDAADSIDQALATSDAGIRAVKLSLVGLGATALLQLVVVWFSGSAALLADTIHNVADASTAIPLWIAFSIGRRLPTRRYTYGYGRAEDLAGVFVILMIAGSAALAGWESLRKLLDPQPIEHLGWVAAAGVIGCLGNELVAQYRIRTGERIGSAALVADGYHARTDGLTSLAVVLGAAGVWLGVPRADPLVGLGITVAIVYILKDAVVQIWRRLMDGVEPALVDRLEAAAAAAAGVQSVSSVRVRWVGHTLHADALIVADRDLSLAQAHAVAERARHAMHHALPRLGVATIHVDPCGHDGTDPHAELEHHGGPSHRTHVDPHVGDAAHAAEPRQQAFSPGR